MNRTRPSLSLDSRVSETLKQVFESKMIVDSTFTSVIQFDRYRYEEIPEEYREERLKQDMIQNFSKYILAKKLNIETEESSHSIRLKQQLLVLRRGELKDFMVAFIKTLSLEDIMQIHPEASQYQKVR